MEKIEALITLIYMKAEMSFWFCFNAWFHRGMTKHSFVLVRNHRQKRGSAIRGVIRLPGQLNRFSYGESPRGPPSSSNTSKPQLPEPHVFLPASVVFALEYKFLPRISAQFLLVFSKNWI